MKNNKLLKFNKYIIIFLFIIFLFGIGGTYAYYTFQVESETSVIAGNVIAIDLDLSVELVVGTNTKMVPLLDAALSNALNAVDSDNGACIDSLGNLSCQVYKITLTNNGSRIKDVVGTVELYAKDGTGNAYTNLKWRELTNPLTIKNDGVINGMNKSVLVSDLTMESKTEKIWYIAVWISEQDYDQRETDKGLFGGTVTFEPGDGSSVSAGINRPNLDNGNLIPVYYDDTVVDSDGTYGVWKKADSSNANNSWYDYNNKKWANAVIIGDSTKKSTYSSASVGTIIPVSDITAFYVWIPRFKYRVWNITRQGGAESTYAYPAFTKGIDIEFETGTSSTGNVNCIYNEKNNSPSSVLSNICIYNGTETITPSSGNTNYTDAWYTHPAFTFGNNEIEGFWMGKFETSTDTSSACYTTSSADNCNNTNQNPRVLPDVSSLRNQNISNQFTTAKKFQTYLSDINAHMLTNLEWGAVTYLTHSIYGLCNGTTCQGVYQNNSIGYYTGRSGGDIAGSTNLNLVNVYGGSVTTSTTKYNASGYYNYKGYKIDYSTGKTTTIKDISKVASTTGNVTGVYDMSGGAYEYVMGNMVDSSGAFYPSSAGTSWNGGSILDSLYYNAYSYGTNYYAAIAFNRARLGDATAEVLGGKSNSSSWKVGKGITGSNSSFVSSSLSWFSRGGLSSSSNSGAFYFGYGTGTSNDNNSFRSSLS